MMRKALIFVAVALVLSVCCAGCISSSQTPNSTASASSLHYDPLLAKIAAELTAENGTTLKNVTIFENGTGVGSWLAVTCTLGNTGDNNMHAAGDYVTASFSNYPSIDAANQEWVYASQSLQVYPKNYTTPTYFAQYEVSKALGYPGTPPNNTMTTNARAWFADPSNHTTEEVYQYDSVLVSAYNFGHAGT